MSSFNRDDYERTFRFALMVYNQFESRGGIEEWAIQIMNQCEEVLGQMSERPKHSRHKAKI